MIAIVASVVLPTLFIGSGVFATVVLGTTWRRHGAAIQRLRAELAACETAQDLAVSVVVSDLPDLAPAVRRGSVRPVRRAAVRPVLPVLRPALNAVA